MTEALWVGIGLGMVLQFALERSLLPRLAHLLAQHGWR